MEKPFGLGLEELLDRRDALHEEVTARMEELAYPRHGTALDATKMLDLHLTLERMGVASGEQRFLQEELAHALVAMDIYYHVMDELSIPISNWCEKKGHSREEVKNLIGRIIGNTRHPFPEVVTEGGYAARRLKELLEGQLCGSVYGSIKGRALELKRAVKMVPKLERVKFESVRRKVELGANASRLFGPTTDALSAHTSFVKFRHELEQASEGIGA